ncbi:hypothetical protein Y032_0054g2511 [Ancylostoma ceylanicum]|uniref:5' nucleotidase family protein n=1 Tax=Ancylostoma ceylanicum TaxID=53326 RepID=A0A016U7Z0_9BILA|nr:hypothetical protein Y032_0054g2511 [Ancylostoma ceylanicum]
MTVEDSIKLFLENKLNTVTGRVKLGSHSGPLKRGDVYSRGCAAEFIQRMGLAGKDILYVGDHIFGDVLKSKKVGGWRTLLIVPELDNEMKIWSSQLMKFNGLLELNNSLSDFQTIQQSAIRKKILKEITRITDDMESEFGMMGSMLRCGWRQTHFAAQLKKYADLYTCNVYNLIEYSGTHYFNSPIQLLPHEEKIMRGFIDTKSINTFDERSSEEGETLSDISCCGCCLTGNETI